MKKWHFFLLIVLSQMAFTRELELCLSGSGFDGYDQMYEFDDGSKLFQVLSNSNDSIFHRDPASSESWTYFVKTSADNRVIGVYTDSIPANVERDYKVVPTPGNEAILFRIRNGEFSNSDSTSVLYYAVIDEQGQVRQPFTMLDSLEMGYFRTPLVIDRGEGHYRFFALAHYAGDMTNIDFLYKIYHIEDYQVAADRLVDPLPPAYPGDIRQEAVVKDSTVIINMGLFEKLGSGLSAKRVLALTAGGDTLLDIAVDTATVGDGFEHTSALMCADNDHVWLYVSHYDLDLLNTESVYVIDMAGQAVTRIFLRETPYADNWFWNSLLDTRSGVVLPEARYALMVQGLTREDSICTLYRLTADSLQPMYDFLIGTYFMTGPELYVTPDSGLLAVFETEDESLIYWIFRFDQHGNLLDQQQFSYGGNSHVSSFDKYLPQTDDLVVCANEGEAEKYGGIRGVVDFKQGILQDNWSGEDGIESICNVFANDAGELFTVMQTYYPSPCFEGTSDVVVYKVLGVPTALPDAAGNRRKLLVFPNPAQDILYIELHNLNGENVQLKIFDLAGRELRSGFIGQDRVELDISALPAGAYVIRAESEQGVRTAKVIIAR